MSKLVLVTGASGFLASHVIQQLLIQGYRVRGTARGPKVNELRTIYASEPTVDIVEIEDIAHGQFSQVFDGVYAVIHTASPLSGRETAEKLLNSAVEGSLNVLRQAEKAGITKFVVTSSIAAVLGDPKAQGSTIKPDHWSPITWEQGLAGGGDMTTYRASKKFAELAVWEWADAHPHVDITTILPPFLYGPIASPSYLASHPSPHSISTNIHVYHLLSAPGTDNHNNETPTTLPPPVGGYVDVRDAARAHVGALERLITESSSSPSQLGAAQSTSDGTSYRKRVVLASPHGLSWIRAVEILRASRPDLSARLNKALLQGDSKDLEEMKALKSYDVDFEWSERLTGLKKGDYRSFEETILDGVDSLIKAEAIWTRA